MAALMNDKKTVSWKLRIPANVKVVFVFSDGKKHNVTPKLFSELSDIYSWMVTRLDEIQHDIHVLERTSKGGKMSVLELYPDGRKNLYQNIDTNDYSMN